MITAMFFGDIIIKVHHSAGEVHVRGVNNETEQGSIKYIFFVFFAGSLVYKVGGTLLKMHNALKLIVPTNSSVKIVSPADLEVSCP